MIDLRPLPCPFCGHTGVVVDADTESVVCNGCDCTGPSMLSKEFDNDEAMFDAAVTAWNERMPIGGNSDAAFAEMEAVADAEDGQENRK